MPEMTKAQRAAYTFFCERRGDYDLWAEAVTAAWRVGEAITPTLTREKIETLALTAKWEKDWNTLHTQGLQMLASEPEIRVEEQLRTLLEQETKARQILNTSTSAMTKPDHSPTQDETNRYRIAQDKWLEICAAITEKTDALRQQELEARNAPAWREAYNKLVVKLGEQYKGLGPQYELLVGRLAAVEIKLQQMEISGREIGGTEYKQWHDIHLNYVKRLQDHTESRTMRVENIDMQLRAVLTAVLESMGRQMIPFAPDAWREGLLRIPGVIEAKKLDFIAESAA